MELPQNQPTTINMLSAIHPEGPAFNTRGRTAQQHSSNDPLPHTDATLPVIPETGHTTLKSLSADKLDALLQMQKTDPFWQMNPSKHLSNGKSPKHEADLFIHVKKTALQTCHELAHQKFLALSNPQGIKIHGIGRSA